MTKITPSSGNLYTPVDTAQPEPEATTSGAQAKEGSTSPRLLPRDNPSSALRRRDKHHERERKRKREPDAVPTPLNSEVYHEHKRKRESDAEPTTLNGEV